MHKTHLQGDTNGTQDDVNTAEDFNVEKIGIHGEMFGRWRQTEECSFGAFLSTESAVFNRKNQMMVTWDPNDYGFGSTLHSPLSNGNGLRTASQAFVCPFTWYFDTE